MSGKDSLIDNERLINLFGTFVLGTVSLIISFYLIPKTNLLINIKQGLFLLTLYTYLIVIYSLGAYYYTKGKAGLIKRFKKNKNKYLSNLIIIMAIIYLAIAFYNNRDLLNLIQNFLLVILALVSIPQVNKRLTKWWYKIGKNKQKPKKEVS